MKRSIVIPSVIGLCLFGCVPLPSIYMTEESMALDYEVGAEYQVFLGDVMASAEWYSLRIERLAGQESYRHPVTNQRMTRPVATADTTRLVRAKADIVYMGLEDSVMKVKYREFAGEDQVIRKDFELDLEYDLSESMEIVFRGLSIAVQEINPSSVTYQIQADDGSSLLPVRRGMSTRSVGILRIWMYYIT